MSDIYLKFLLAISKLELNQNQHKTISPTATLLLNEIAIREFENIPMTVKQALELNSIGSRANLQRKLFELRDAGMVEARHLKSNKVIKYLFTTQLAKDNFQIKSQAMLNALEIS